MIERVARPVGVARMRALGRRLLLGAGAVVTARVAVDGALTGRRTEVVRGDR